MTDSIDRSQQLQAERIEELARHGIKANRGGFLGSIELPATEAAKVLKLLRRLERLEKEAGQP